MTEKLKSGLGIVIGRFQVPKLHPGHLHIISQANRHGKLLVIVGRTQNKNLMTQDDPLDYETVKMMIQGSFPNAVIAGVADQPDDHIWSDNIDRVIYTLFPAEATKGDVTLYGGRDSFIPHYHGRYKAVVSDEVSSCNGTTERIATGSRVIDSPDFRSGMIYANFNRPKLVNPTVDIALFTIDWKNVLLLQKPNKPGFWRFPGGFVDPDLDDSLDAAAKREAEEEVDYKTEHMHYVGSKRILDWRDSSDTSVMTALFATRVLCGTGELKDDVKGGESYWFPLEDILRTVKFADSHDKLAEMLILWAKERIIPDAKQAPNEYRLIQSNTLAPVSIRN